VRGILRAPGYTENAYAERTCSVPAHIRHSTLRPVGPGRRPRPAPPEAWIAIPVPALISPETFAAAQARVERNPQMTRWHNTAHEYLLRDLVRGGQCQLACTGRTVPPDYPYYSCRSRSNVWRAAWGDRCKARVAPARTLDALVGQELCRILTAPALISHKLARARDGAWLL
jgi:site-specific DNA recombinase